VLGWRAIGRTAGGRRLETAGTAFRRGDRVLALLRPDAATVGDATSGADDELVGIVEDVADSGPLERARVRLDGGERVTVTRPRRAAGSPLRPGARVPLR